MLKSRLKQAFLRAAGAVTGREVQLLPRAAAREETTLSLRAPYRVEARTLTVELLETEPGALRVDCLERAASGPGACVFTAAVGYPGPSTLSFDLETGELSLGAQSLGRAPVPKRRFCLRLTVETARQTKTRLTGHYRAVVARAVDARYFEGDVYADHDHQGPGESAIVLEWLQRFGARGPLLEVGCATGAVLAAVEAAGIPAWGLDSSSWAVARARERHRADRVFEADVENGDWPAPILAAGPFETLVLWSVFEHLREPFATLDRLGDLLAPGGVLLLQATNADSLTHALFGSDWEGYFDWTHLGVERVSASSLRAELPRLGYTIEHLHTHMIWTGSDDPGHATLRDWHAADARLRRLLLEKDRGDLVLVVARRRGRPA